MFNKNVTCTDLQVEVYFQVEALMKKTLITIAVIAVFGLSILAITKQQNPQSDDNFLDLSAREMIEAMEASDETYDLQLASLTAKSLLVIDKDDKEFSIPVGNEFYLSLAPYINMSHECYNHSLLTCQGELVNEKVRITITDSRGTTLVDEETKTKWVNLFKKFEK